MTGAPIEVFDLDVDGSARTGVTRRRLAREPAGHRRPPAARAVPGGRAGRSDALDIGTSGVVHLAFANFGERGTANRQRLLGLSTAYLAPLPEAGADTPLLGRAQYPSLAGVNSLVMLVMGEDVTLAHDVDETTKDVGQRFASPGSRSLAASPRRAWAVVA